MKDREPSEPRHISRSSSSFSAMTPSSSVANASNCRGANIASRRVLRPHAVRYHRGRGRRDQSRPGPVSPPPGRSRRLRSARSSRTSGGPEGSSTCSTSTSGGLAACGFVDASREALIAVMDMGDSPRGKDDAPLQGHWPRRPAPTLSGAPIGASSGPSPSTSDSRSRQGHGRVIGVSQPFLPSDRPIGAIQWMFSGLAGTTGLHLRP